MQNVYPKSRSEIQSEASHLLTKAELEAKHADRIVHCMNCCLGIVASRGYVLRETSANPDLTAPYKALWDEIVEEGVRFRDVNPGDFYSSKDYLAALAATNKWLDPDMFYDGLKREKGVSSWRKLKEVCSTE
jgi:hypothetical protein